MPNLNVSYLEIFYRSWNKYISKNSGKDISAFLLRFLKRIRQKSTEGSPWDYPGDKIIKVYFRTDIILVPVY